MSIRKSLTPGIGEKGLYVLNSPFVMPQGVAFVCISISDFNTLEGRIHVAKKLYKEVGLSDDIFNEDKFAGVRLLTLSAAGYDDIIVPDSYMASLPILDGTDYTQQVITIDLGHLPISIPLDDVIMSLSETLENTLGVDGVFDTFEYEDITIVRSSEHVISESARTTKMSKGKTYFQEIAELKTENQQLRTELAIYKQHIRDIQV